MVSKPYIGCVYLATNLINGRAYVGKTTVSLRVRINQHHHKAFTDGAQRPFYAALRKYGRAAFSWSAYYCSDDNAALLSAEVGLIADCRADGIRLYNLTDGGEGTIGLVRSPEQRAAVSLRHKGSKRPRAAVEASAAARRGSTLSAETRAKISATRLAKGVVVGEAQRLSVSERFKGKAITEEHRLKIVAALTGRTVSTETRAKISAAQIGRNQGVKLTEDHRLKIVAGLIGRPVSDATRAKMSASAKARWATRRRSAD